MKQIKVNILDIKTGILCHQVNCLGIAGGGIALQIRNRFPNWYINYKDYCLSSKSQLGEVQLFQLAPQLFIANLFCQYDIGGHATVESSYDIALPKIAQAAADYKLDIFYPYRIGAGLGGGDWNLILSKLEKFTPNATIVEFTP